MNRAGDPLGCPARVFFSKAAAVAFFVIACMLRVRAYAEAGIQNLCIGKRAEKFLSPRLYLPVPV